MAAMSKTITPEACPCGGPSLASCCGPFIEGSAIKYLTRWRDKGGIDDLKKARHFIDMLIELEEKPKS